MIACADLVIDAVTLEYRVGYLLAHPAKLADMRTKVQALGRPAAGRHVLDTVMGEMFGKQGKSA